MNECCAPCAPVKAVPVKQYTSEYYQMYTIPTSANPIPLANCTAMAYPSKSDGSNKKDENMSNSTADLEIQQRNFLKSRIETLEYSKRNALREYFKMDAAFHPKTKDELIAALLNGGLKFDDAYFTKDGENKYTYSATDLIRYAKVVDPKNLPDEEGYKVAREALRKAGENLKDVVTLAPLAEATKAFEDFKSATFH